MYLIIWVLIRRGRTFKFAFKNLHGAATPSLEVGGENGEHRRPWFISLHSDLFWSMPRMKLDVATQRVSSCVFARLVVMRTYS